MKRAFVELGVDKEVEDIYSKNKLPGIFGSKDFKEDVYAKEENTELVNRIKKQSVNAPSVELIVNEVACLMEVEPSSIYQGIRGQRQVTRWMAMGLCQTLGRITLKEITTAFNIKHVSGVTHQVRQLKALVSKDGKVYG